jgi:hypothetical protein
MKLECYPLWEMSLHQNNVWHVNMFEYRTTKFLEDVNHSGFGGRTDGRPPPTHTHTHARVTLGVGKSVSSFHLRNISQKRQNRLRSLKKVSCKHTHTHTHTHDSQGWQLCIVTLLAKYFAGMTEKVQKVKECDVCRQGTEEGWIKVR